MADSSTSIPQILQSQAQKEVLANALFDASTPAMLYGRNAVASLGLVWGYLGGRIYVNGAPVVIANGTLTLAANQNHYLEVGINGAVTSNTSGFSADRVPLYRVQTGPSSVINYEDHRSPLLLQRLCYGRAVMPLNDADLVLTLPQALCHSLEFSGSLTARRNVSVPAVARHWIVAASTSGGFGIQLKTASASSGASVTLADGQRKLVECDGLNLYLIG